MDAVVPSLIEMNEEAISHMLAARYPQAAHVFQGGISRFDEVGLTHEAFSEAFPENERTVQLETIVLPSHPGGSPGSRGNRLRHYAFAFRPVPGSMGQLSPIQQAAVVSTIMLFNQGLCYHKIGFMTGDPEQYRIALRSYYGAEGLLNATPDYEVSLAVLGLAILNNLGCIHFNFLQVDRTAECLESMSTMLELIGEEIPHDLTLFEQNIAGNTSLPNPIEP